VAKEISAGELPAGKQSHGTGNQKNDERIRGVRSKQELRGGDRTGYSRSKINFHRSRHKFTINPRRSPSSLSYLIYGNKNMFLTHF
jgi:hypothetical protein